jgi:methylated-DNA-protein-cysteine methyltransferase-like protein
MNPHAERLYAAVKKLPRGKVVSYGQIGAFLTPPLTGRMVGRLMASCPTRIPWWRVVAKSGQLPIYKRSPALAHDQEHLLRKEGVEVIDGRIKMTRWACTDEELSTIL